VEGERGAEDRRGVEVGRHAGEPAQVPERRGEPHHGASAEDGSILNRLYTLGGAAVGWLAEELLASTCIASAFSRLLGTALETKARADRVVQTLLGLLSLPSRADLNRIGTKLDVIQGSLVNLSLKVDRLLANQPARRRRAPGRPPAPPPEAAKD
jgi:hypothetical protein